MEDSLIARIIAFSLREKSEDPLAGVAENVSIHSSALLLHQFFESRALRHSQYLTSRTKLQAFSALVIASGILPNVSRH